MKKNLNKLVSKIFLGVGIVSTSFLHNVTTILANNEYVNIPLSQVYAIKYIMETFGNKDNILLTNSYYATGQLSNVSFHSSGNYNYAAPYQSTSTRCSYTYQYNSDKISSMSCSGSDLGSSVATQNYSENGTLSGSIAINYLEEFKLPIFSVEVPSNYVAPDKYQNINVYPYISTNNSDVIVVLGVGYLYDNNNIRVCGSTGECRLVQYTSKFSSLLRSNDIYFKYYKIPYFAPFIQLSFPELYNSRTLYPLYIGAEYNLPREFASILGIKFYDTTLLEQLVEQGKLNSAQQNTITNNNTFTNQADSKVGQLESIESVSKNNLNTNLQKVNVNQNITNNASFVKTASFVSLHFMNIVKNNPFGDVITYSLILGLSLAMIGKIRRGK